MQEGGNHTHVKGHWNTPITETSLKKHQTIHLHPVQLKVYSSVHIFRVFTYIDMSDGNLYLTDFGRNKKLGKV